MNTLIKHLRGTGLGLALSTALLPAILPGPAYAVVSSYTMADFTAYPIVTASNSVTPMVMLAMSKDHTLFFKAYNDYADIDPAEDDGIETTYKHSFDYYGYFDSYKCYDYSSVNGRFEPQAVTDNKYCDSVAGAWSGNFLNWASMARIDVIRKVLYGGNRRIDTNTTTVLERTYLPNDAHSWAKYYNGSDISKLTPLSPPTTDADPKKNGLTLCNTTVNNTSAKSEEVTDPPLIRVAYGNYSLWAGNERWQCRWSEEKTDGNGNNATDETGEPLSGIDAYPSNPSSAATGSASYIARIQACVSGLEEANCKQYPTSTHKKPIGLLQSYGDDNKLHFGLMAGSYEKNKSGGDLYKDIGTITDEINTTTDGTFKYIYTLAKDGGVDFNSSTGLINALSLFRIVGYYHSDGTYGTGPLNSNNCPWGKNAFSNGECMNWGNPFSEIFLNALRYFAGEPPSGQFRTSARPIKGLPVPLGFSCPLSSTNACARLNIVALNSSTFSYDADELDGASYGIQTLGASSDSTTLTNTVGAAEGIHGKNYFVGQSGASNDGLCTSKTISALGDTTGICPETPRLGGSHRVAGLAHWSHTNDIRKSGPNALSGSQLVDTYAVSLSPGAPIIDIPVPNSSNKIHIVPACRNSSISGNCAIVDFKIVQPHTVSGGVGTGKFYVNWEDSEQGGDFDQDMWGTISYSVTSTNITVTTDVHAESTIYKMGFGFIIAGTTKDGMHAYSGIEGFSFTDPTSVTACSSCNMSDAAVSYTFTLGSSSTDLLKDPLWYAAKWGGFDDENGNNKPDLQSEWDKFDTRGNASPDGIPDNYFYVSDPRELERSLSRVFDNILNKTASGTAAAVVASSREGLGAIYQALYETSRKDADNREVKWIGSLHALWVDEYGLMREDGDNDATLDGYETDPVVEVYYDENLLQTRVRRYTCTACPTPFDKTDPAVSVSTVGLTALRPLWNARDRLSALSNSTITSQRSYTTSASTGRHILAWIDADNDGVVDSGETKDFTSSNITGTNYTWFDVATQSEAQNIVDFIRGKNGISGFRNREINFDNSGATEIMRLGDITDSTPTVVTAPAEAYDLLYGDTSYSTFRAQYANRRQMIYVGANDGLLHAFNGGFYNPKQKKFNTSITTQTAHPLGAELWAYAPKNLLPHLKWLKDPNYTHVYYMDGKPRAFDAKIFANDATHPGGWGTILVAGMRLGGGEMVVDTGNNGYGGVNPKSSCSARTHMTNAHHPSSNCDNDDAVLSSAYVVLDITDPEQPPTVLAEVGGYTGGSYSKLGYTTSYPTAMAMRAIDNSVNGWYLVFGSGPTTLTTAVSGQNAKIYAWDLVNRTWATNFGPSSATNTLDAASFVGDPVTADWDLDFKADAVYFGTVGGTAAAPTGKLYKLKLTDNTSSHAEITSPASWTAPAALLNPGKPIMTTPSLALDEFGKHWIFVGTGRLLAEGDKSSTAQQSLYGIKDPENNITTALTNLVDVTDAMVFTDSVGSLEGVTGYTTFSALENGIDSSKDGWVKNLCLSTATTPCARMITPSSLLGKILLMPVYTPNTDQCQAEGTSGIYGLYYKTGTAMADPTVFGTDAAVTNANGGALAVDFLDLGRGIASSPSIHIGSGTKANEETVYIQTSTGAIEQKKATTSGSLRSGETSWREIAE